ncbi:hypothetical protein ACIQC9_14330 [Brevundimonas sp. NPDC092305]|uniref:hypothetical protein n=1 Tax=Brevundimonas sp. NPDC092305 TaxID=3363957 RepID=UPI0038087630
MGLYQFHFYDADGGRPTLDFFDGDDDGAASCEAFRSLRQHLSCLGVEVYEGERLVARLERPEGRVAGPGSAIHGAG